MYKDIFRLTDIIRSYENLVDYLLDSRSLHSLPKNYEDLKALEKDMLIRTIIDCDGIITDVAKKVGVRRNTLYYRLYEFGLKKEKKNGS